MQTNALDESLVVIQNEFSKLNNKFLSQKNEFFKLQEASFNYIGCVIVYSFVNEIHFLQTFSFSGDKIAEYNIEESEEVEIVKMKIVRNEWFMDRLVVCTKFGDLYIFDLPFLNFGWKINSSHKNHLNCMLSINKNQTLLMGYK